MGDRANVKISDRYSGDLYLYTHWAGTELPETVQRALKRRERWDDMPYLARIVFCEMVKGNEDGATGFGISAKPCDGDDRIVEVSEDGVKLNGRRYTFEEYLALRDLSWSA